MTKLFITESQKKYLYELSNRGNEREVEKYIVENCSSMVSSYLYTPLSNIPYFIKQCCNPNGQESAMWKSVSSHPSKNRFIDFLRINFYVQFGFTHGNGPKFFMPGFARIACEELGFYSFNPEVMQGQKIVKLSQISKIMSNNPELFENINLDEYFNNLDYNSLINMLNPIIKNYIENINNELDKNEINDNINYKIYPIEDFINNQGIAILTKDSKRFLNSLGKYTDWCICGTFADMEYAQYVSNGGKMYICLRNDFKNIEKIEGENCPLDDYGLSMIAVVVGENNFTELITTRWNHDHDGENNKNLHNPLQLQHILNIPYKKYFKKRSQESLEKMHINENKKILSEAKQVDDIIKVFAKKSPNINTNDLKELLVNGDPTSISNDRGQFIGKYGTWIGNLFKNNKIKKGDIPELNHALNIYNINKSQINKNINEFSNLDELVKVISNYDDSFKAQRTISKGEQELEKVYEDQYVTVYIPHTWKAARKIGGDTRWCTASSNDERFNFYLNKYGGEYYDIIKKSDNSKYQIHPESDQFKDSQDDECNFGAIFYSSEECKGLINFLKNRGKNIKKWIPNTYFGDVETLLKQGLSLDDIFDSYYSFNKNYYEVSLNDKKNIIKVNDNFSDAHLIFRNKYYDNFFEFKNNGYVKAKLNGKYGIINVNSQYIPIIPCEFDNIHFPDDNGYAFAELNGKWGIFNVNSQYNPIIPYEYDNIYYLDNNGYAKARLNGKYGIINVNSKHNPIIPCEYDDIFKLNKNGYAEAELDGKWGIINVKSKHNPIIPCEYDNIFVLNNYSHKNGYVGVELNGKYGIVKVNSRHNPIIPCEYDSLSQIDRKLKELETQKNISESKNNKKIYLTESQLNYIENFNLLCERYNIEPEKILIVKKYLDDNMVKTSMVIQDEMGMPKVKYLVQPKDPFGNIFQDKFLTDVDLFYLIQDKFKNITNDINSRDNLLKQIIKDWYNSKISNQGLLSKNYIEKNPIK